MRLAVTAEHRIVPAGVGCLKLISNSTGAVLAMATTPGPWTVTAWGSEPITVAAEEVITTMAEQARKSLPGYPDNNLTAITEIGENL